MRHIFVDPSTLESFANQIDDYSSQYRNKYQLLNNEVDRLQISWNGKDNMAFTNQIKGYNDDFEKIHMILNQYSHYLKNAARAYRETQNELIAQITRLTN